MSHLDLVIAAARGMSDVELALTVGAIVEVVVERHGRERACDMLRTAADALGKLPAVPA